jgi:hypothetical protein
LTRIKVNSSFEYGFLYFSYQHRALAVRIQSLISILFCIAFLLSSCTSDPNPIVSRAPGIIITRRDNLAGKISVIIDGKNTAKISPSGKWGVYLHNARYTIALEYRKMRSNQMVFYIQGNRIEFDVWAYENSEPIIKFHSY